jgi:hypothetical protein
MTQGKRYAMVCLALLVAGGIRMPLEGKFHEELGEAGLLPPKLEQTTGDKIGQTFSAVSLGGLRTLVATFLNLRAFTYFTEQRWGEVWETFQMIVDLAPRTRYYWDTGSWHQAYNAASHYLYESKLPPLRRKEEWRASILRGRDFLERGISNNPHDGVLIQRLGLLYSDANKITAFGDTDQAFFASYKAYMAAQRTGNAPSYVKRFALYSLARVSGKESEALALLWEIRKKDPYNVPTMMALSYILQAHETPTQPTMDLVDSIFPNRKNAYDTLSVIWRRSRERFPVYGVASALALLEADLKIPAEKSALKADTSGTWDIEDAFAPAKK